MRQSMLLSVTPSIWVVMRHTGMGIKSPWLSDRAFFEEVRGCAARQYDPTKVGMVDKSPTTGDGPGR